MALSFLWCLMAGRRARDRKDGRCCSRQPLQKQALRQDRSIWSSRSPSVPCAVQSLASTPSAVEAGPSRAAAPSTSRHVLRPTPPRPFRHSAFHRRATMMTQRLPGRLCFRLHHQLSASDF
jgi:hypothetical protein